ncbi:MAG: heparinase II/III family protein [Clostridia bacterium]|nr:heparinase II/III family protein [Clostridia bacterium]
MFEHIIQNHSLRDMIVMPVPTLFPPATDRAAWEGLPLKKRSALRRLAADWKGKAYPSLLASRFMAFGRAGDRVAYETPYFNRRRKLCAAVLGACEGGGTCESSDMTVLDDVIDGIWLICEETSWVISAHNGSDHAGVPPASERLLPDVTNPYVDLFAAQTAMILSLSCQLLAEELDGASPLIRRRVRMEVERRVLVPFETRDDFWWMGVTRRDLNNWTPWIVSNVLLTACAWVDDRLRLAALIERGLAMLERYLAVIPADGSCDEGPGYWSMAGGALLDCLQLLERATGGRLSLWDDEKLENILRFPMRMCLGDDWFVNYADCDARPDIPGERLLVAGEMLGDAALAAFGRRFRGGLESHLADTPQLWRLLCDLFHGDEDGEGAVAPPEDVWLEDLQLRILRRGDFALVCKGGVNEGGHNHNDCGSFMVWAGGEPQIVDAGNMTYTGKTFSSERYTLWNTRAMYHNVPMIGGCEQVNGWERRARDVESLPNGLGLDMAPAYPEGAGVLECRREATCTAAGCRIGDVIRLERPESVTEVFLLRNEPVIEGNTICAGRIRIAPDRPMDSDIEEIPITDPRMARSFPGSLWRVRFSAPAGKEHRLGFWIRER